MKKLALLVACVLPHVACISMSSFQTARTLKSGEGRIVLGGGVYKVPELDSVLSNLGDTRTLSLPYAEILYRWGAGTSSEWGLKWTMPGGIGLDYKLNLINGSLLALALGAGGTYTSYKMGNTEQTIIDVFLPLYLSLHFSEGFALYGSPKFVYRMPSGSASSKNGQVIGATVGVKIGSGWGLMAEYSVFQDGTRSDAAMIHQIGGGLYF